MQNPSELKFTAAVIAAGMIQSHGLPDSEIARKSISLAREIDRQVDDIDESAPEGELRGTTIPGGATTDKGPERATEPAA